MGGVPLPIDPFDLQGADDNEPRSRDPRDNCLTCSHAVWRHERSDWTQPDSEHCRECEADSYQHPFSASQKSLKLWDVLVDQLTPIVGSPAAEEPHPIWDELRRILRCS